MHSAVLAIVESVCPRPSICLLRAGTVSKRLTIKSRGLRCRIAPLLSFLPDKIYRELPKGTFWTGAPNEKEVEKIAILANKSPYLKYSQNGGLIGSRIRAFPKLWTLGDLELPIRTLLQKRSFLEHTRKIWMKIDPCCKQHWCRTTTLVRNVRHDMRIIAGVRREGDVKRERGCRQRLFSTIF